MDKLKKILQSKKFYEIAFIATGIATFALWVIGLLLNAENSTQMQIFFGNGNNSFADTVNVVGYSAQRDVYHNMNYLGLDEKAYPPLTYMLMYFFSKFVDTDWYYSRDWFADMYTDEQFLIVFLIVTFITGLFIYETVRSFKNGSNAMKVLIALVVCVSNPMLFSFQRGNTIMLVLALEMLYIFWYDSDNKIKREVALISLALMVAFKLTPVVLGILLLFNKQWKDAVKAVIYGLLVGFLPFLFFKGGFSNFFQMLSNMQANLESYGSGHGTTLTASLVYFGVIEGTTVQGKILQYITYILCVIILVGALFFKKRWERVVAITTVLVVAMPHSEYYNILYLVPGWIFFLNEEEHRAGDVVMLISMMLIINDFQTTIVDKLLNYHLALIILIVFILIKAMRTIVQAIKTKSTGSAVLQEGDKV